MQANCCAFVAMDSARTVTQDQLTVLIERDQFVSGGLPVRCELGGMSGGPIIALFESGPHSFRARLAGIVTEHPNYVSDGFSPEQIIGTSAEVITEYGTIR